MRVFYALTFNDEIKSQLSKYRDLIIEHSSKGKFIDTSNIHLTLEFIGNIDADQLTLYKQILSELTLNRITLTVNYFGKFTKKNKDIVWLGIKKNEDFINLVNELNEQLLKYNLIEKQDELIPHITLGRQIVLTEDLENHTINDFNITVKSLALMESKRVNDQLVYLPVYEVTNDHHS